MTAYFEIHAGLVYFHDKSPGQHATLFGADGRKFAFDGAASRFNDDRRTYSWAFRGSLRTDERIIFATADREVSGLASSLATPQILPLGSHVVRAPDGKPLYLQSTAVSPSPAYEPPPSWPPPPVLARDLW